MSFEGFDEQQAKRYLLGLLPESEAASLEQRGLADYDFFERILSVEDRLIDDYLLGQLAPQDRMQFEQHFLSSPKRKERVEFADTFLKSMSRFSVPKPIPVSVEKDGAGKTLWVERLRSFFGHQGKRFVPAAAAMLLVILAGWSFWETRRIRNELAQVENTSTSLRQREQELQARLNSQQAQNEELRQEIERNRAELEQLKAEAARSSPATIVALMLRPPALREPSPSRIPRLSLRPTASSARLTLVVDQELIEAILKSHPKVRAELRRAGNIQWTQEGLTPRRVKAGKAFIVTLPAERLSAGNYQIRLIGTGSAGDTVIADYPFQVEMK